MTQNKETYRFKGRAVFLAAIMVISVLAMPIAFAGSAAASADSGSVTFNDQVLNEDGQVLVEDAEALEGGDPTDASVVITYADGDDVIVAGVEGFDGTEQDVSVTVEDAGGFPGDHTANIVPNSELDGVSIGDDISEAIDDGDVAPVAEETATVFDGEVEIVDQTYVGDTDEVIVEVASLLDGDTNDDFAVALRDESDDTLIGTKTTDLSGENTNVTIDSGTINSDTEVYASLHENTDPGNNPILVAEDDDLVTFRSASADITIVANAEELAEDFGVDRAFADTEALKGALVYQGQEIAVAGLDANSDVQLRQRIDSDVNRLRNELTTDSSGVVTFETDTRNEGDYFLRGAGSTMNADIENTFEIAEQDLTAEFEDETVTDSGANSVTDLEVDSVRGTYALNVSADGDLDIDDLEEIFVTNGDFDLEDTDDDEDRITLQPINDGEFEVNFTGIDEGDYDFDFEVIDSTASASDSITVEDAGDGELSVEDATERQGDIAEIVVSADNTDEGTIVIGDEDDVNYQLNASIDFGDIDEVTVYFNTYAAGQLEDGDVDADQILFLDEDDRDEDAELSNIEESGSIDGLLDTGDYEVTVSADADPAETFDNPDDVGSLFLEERSLDDINTWTAADNVVEDLLNEDEDDPVDFALEGIENDLITPSDAIAHDDFVVHQLEASGLEGLLANSSDGDASAQLEAALGNEAIDLRVRETRDSVGPNAVRDRVDFDETDVTVLHDDDNEQYFLIINTDDIVLQNSEEALEKDEDYEFDVRFQLQDERLLDVDEDDLDEADGLSDFFEDVTTDHEVVERDGSFDLSDDDQIEVEAGDEQLITGDTNIAPGSEVQIRIRGSGDARFSKSQSDIVVDADGNFAGEFDFSDSNVDDEFTATLRNVVTEDDNPEEDGIVVDSVDEVDDDDMDDADDEPVDTDDDMDDEPVDTDDDDTVEETEDDTPGFGALVALLAVLGAALLAVRRQN